MCYKVNVYERLGAFSLLQINCSRPKTNVYAALCLQGGMRAVVWVDAFQCFVMLGGLIALVVSVSVRLLVYHLYINKQIVHQF